MHRPDHAPDYVLLFGLTSAIHHRKCVYFDQPSTLPLFTAVLYPLQLLLGEGEALGWEHPKICL